MGIYLNPENDGFEEAANFFDRQYVIYQHIGNLSKRNNGWTKELNYISWDDREPVYDIRTWNAEHTKYGKGVTITAGQMRILKKLLDEINVS